MKYLSYPAAETQDALHEALFVNIFLGLFFRRNANLQQSGNQYYIDVRAVDVGGRLMVSPNVDVDVLAMAASRGMVTMPGVFSATEAFLALRHGASALKFFPASILGASGIAAIRAVLPRDAVIGAVGGVSDKNFADYIKAGVQAFGLGSSLYKPGMSATEVKATALASVTAYDLAVAR